MGCVVNKDVQTSPQRESLHSILLVTSNNVRKRGMNLGRSGPGH